MKILIYSFEKCYKLKNNPAYEVGRIITKKFNSNDVELIQLPVTYKSWETLKQKMEEVEPDFVLGIGVSVGIKRVKIEQIGLNYRQIPMAENDGVKGEVEKIDVHKKLSYETSIDAAAFVSALKENGIPAELSYHAGTYVCNHNYYKCLHYIKDKNIKTLFVHVPVSPKEALRAKLKVKTFSSLLIANEMFDIMSGL